MERERKKEIYCFIYKKVRSSTRDSMLEAFSFLSLLFLLSASEFYACICACLSQAPSLSQRDSDWVSACPGSSWPCPSSFSLPLFLTFRGRWASYIWEGVAATPGSYRLTSSPFSNQEKENFLHRCEYKTSGKVFD